jgi:prephenate dehydrogenase
VATLGDADLVLIATPVRGIEGVLRELAPGLGASSVLTDTGSTKQSIARVAQDVLGARARQFVPGHPIAGRERSGVGAATSELFEGRQVVLTPLPGNSADALARVAGLWKACGAHVVTMDAARHDALFAAVSHLPHLLAFTLVDDLAARPNARELFSYAASGFRDFTRIAGSSPQMWRDIALDNADALVGELDQFIAHAARLRECIASGDAAAIEQLMARAREAREKWQAGELDFFRGDGE